MESGQQHQRSDWVYITLLILIAIGIKGWLLTHTTVVAKDGIKYIKYSQRLQQESWPAVLAEEHQHPLYPIQILLTTKVVQYWTGSNDIFTWQLSAQIANGLCGVLIVIPLYLIGRSLYNRQIGFWAALLFQLMPVASRVTADALSEGTCLFYVAWALLFAIWGLQHHSWYWFTLSGITGGLAYLSRPEGALVLLATGLIIISSYARHIGWRKAFAAASTLTVAGVITILPYCWTIGRISGKPSIHRMIDNQILDNPSQQRMATNAPTSLWAVRFSYGVDGKPYQDVSFWYAIYKVGDELCKAFHYILWLPLLIGLYQYRQRLIKEPAFALIVLLGFLHFLVICRLAMTLHYVSERHTLTLVLTALPILTATSIFWLVRWLNHQPADPIQPHQRRWILYLGLFGFIAWAGIRTLQPLHPHRLGHKQAGIWLQKHAEPESQLVDPHGWVSFYSGNPRLLPVIRDMPQVPRYFVVEVDDRDWRRMKMIIRGSAKTGKGEAVYSWPDATNPSLVIYKATPPTN